MEVEIVRISARLELLLLILAAMLFVVSCAPSVVATLPNTPEPTFSITAAPTAAQRRVPTATPVVSLSPEEQAALLDQQFQDFLNEEGEYTVEKIEEYCPIWGSRLCYTDGNGTNLGILKIFNKESDEIDKYVSVYGYLYNVARNEDNNIILTMGFVGKDGNRFYTIIGVLSSFYDSNKEDGVVFTFSREEGLHLDDKSVIQFEATSSDQIFDYLNGLRGKKIVIDIPAKKKNLSEVNNDAAKIFWEGSNKRLPYTYNLISRLANNGIDTSAVGSSGKDIPLITSSSDLNDVDFDTVPIAVGIRFRENG